LSAAEAKVSALDEENGDLYERLGVAAEERRELRTDVESMRITLDGLTLALASKCPLEGFES
jgi:hypothetical protein